MSYKAELTRQRRRAIYGAIATGLAVAPVLGLLPYFVWNFTKYAVQLRFLGVAIAALGTLLVVMKVYESLYDDQEKRLTEAHDKREPLRQAIAQFVQREITKYSTLTTLSKEQLQDFARRSFTAEIRTEWDQHLEEWSQLKANPEFDLAYGEWFEENREAINQFARIISIRKEVYGWARFVDTEEARDFRGATAQHKLQQDIKKEVVAKAHEIKQILDGLSPEMQQAVREALEDE